MNQQNTTGSSSSVFAGMMNEIVAAGRLFVDPRVPLYLKTILPIAALIYWVWPFDLMPGLPFDDVAVVVGAIYLFVHLGSKYVNQQQAGAADAQAQAPKDGPVVDTTWRVVE